MSVAGARWEPGEEDVIPWDIEGANQLLEEAGYTDSDGDGVREMPADGEFTEEPGQPLEFRYFVQSNDQNTVKAAPFIEEWLKQVGIGTEVTSMTSTKLGDEINAGTYDLFHWGWIPDPDPDSALSWFQCAERPPDGKTYGNNDSYYCHEDYDTEYTDQRTELDPAARFEIVQQMQKRYYEDSAYAVLWYAPYLQAYRTDTFVGYTPQPAPEGDLLAGYTRAGIFSLQLAGEGNGTGGASDESDGGTSPIVWILIAVAIVVVIGGGIALARRRGDEEDRE